MSQIIIMSARLSPCICKIFKAMTGDVLREIGTKGTRILHSMRNARVCKCENNNGVCIILKVYNAMIIRKIMAGSMEIKHRGKCVKILLNKI